MNAAPLAKPRIAYTKPSITPLEVEYARDAAENGWGERCYDYINRFERAFAEHLGVRYAIATSSCTGALHMGMSALGIGPGDEVILADTNWIATAAPIHHLGATPVFVDVLPDSWCLDPQKVSEAITPRTKAIVAVHIYGNLCEMSSLLELGEKSSIPVIEDAAEAIGSVYRGSRAGSMGLFGAFSFHGTKTLTTGEGGMFVTKDPELYDKVLTLSNHGRSAHQKRQFWPDGVGFKYKMSNIQAALGLAQTERIDSLIERKRQIFQFYRQGLVNYHQIFLNPEPEGVVNGVWMPTIVLDAETGVSSEQLKAAFALENADARVFFQPLSSFEYFPKRTPNPVSYGLPQRAMNLPSFHDITDVEMNRVLDAVKSCLQEH